MSRTFQDHDFLVWEVYSSGGAHGFSENPHAIFNCLSQLNMRPRAIEIGEDEAEAQRLIAEMSDARLVELLEGADDID
ncbi:MAG TPA: hypothetical protein VHG09_00585 [Longimicrobiales bacterium]|nr:hypothetical protein [Longimicrobiales bacterium]